jgi:hypothetical protein
MASSAGCAEISVAGQASRMYGSVVQMSTAGVVVRVERESSAVEHLSSGMPADLTIVTGNDLFTGHARVISSVLDDVALAFSSPPDRTSRPASKGLTCSLSVMFRARRPDGRTGAWQTCNTYDLRVGGICLKLETVLDEIQRVEVCFVLPNDENELPIRATCRVAHQRIRADGTVAVALAFTSISARDKMRLVRFIP